VKDIAVIIPYINEVSRVRNIINLIQDQSNRLSVQLNLAFLPINNAEVSPASIKSLSELDHCFPVSEIKNLNSPYSARNRGIEAIFARYYVFLDATCLPAYNWLEKLSAEIVERVDVLCSLVDMRLDAPENMSIAMKYDSIVNIDNEKTISQNQTAKTACIAVSAEVINSVGMFEEKVRSGGDVIWTQRVTKAGFTIRFCKEWVVKKEPRGAFSLIKKQWRVSVALFRINRSLTKRVDILVKKVLLCWVPPNPLPLIQTAKRRNVNLSKLDIVKLIIFGLLLRIVTGIAVIKGAIYGK